MKCWTCFISKQKTNKQDDQYTETQTDTHRHKIKELNSLFTTIQNFKDWIFFKIFFYSLTTSQQHYNIMTIDMIQQSTTISYQSLSNKTLWVSVSNADWHLLLTKSVIPNLWLPNAWIDRMSDTTQKMACRTTGVTMITSLKMKSSDHQNTANNNRTAF